MQRFFNNLFSENSFMIPILLFAIPVVLIIWIGMAVDKATKKKLRAVAEVLGLKYEDKTTPNLDSQMASLSPEQAKALTGFMGAVAKLASAWRMSGDYLGRLVHISTVTRGSGKNSTTYTTLRVFFRTPLGAGLSLTREGFWAKVGKALIHSQDIEVGDLEFDKKVIVRGSDESRVKGLLMSPSVRNAVMDFLKDHPGGKIDDEGVYCEVVGTVTKEERYRALLDKLTQAVKAVDW